MDIIEPVTQVDFGWAIRLNRLTLNLVGIWPSNHENVYEKFFSNLRVTFTFIVLVFIGAIPAINSLLRIWGDMMSMIDNLQYTLPLITTIIKLVVIWWKKTDLAEAINMIAKDWIKSKTDKERHIMIKQAQNARILTIIGYAFMFLGIALLVILPFFGKSVRYMTNVTDPVKILPLQTHYIYDKDQSPYFEFTFAAQTLMVLMCGASYSGVDNLLGLLVFHLCGQMENLKEKLINIEEFESYNKGLAFIVKDHIRLIKFRNNFNTLTLKLPNLMFLSIGIFMFDVIESTFTLLLLGLLIYFGTLFCLYGFLILAILTEGKEMSIVRFIYIVSVAINICGHMCLFCAVGEILVAQCEGIHHAAYEYEWYKLKPEKAKNLLLIMIRANKPFYITAGKMFPMTMSMFCNLIKTSAGYVSVLLAMQNKKN